MNEVKFPCYPLHLLSIPRLLFCYFQISLEQFLLSGSFSTDDLYYLPKTCGQDLVRGSQKVPAADGSRLAKEKQKAGPSLAGG